MANERFRFSAFYADKPRHWCPQSQRYAGGDALLTYLNDGWEIQDNIYYEEYWLGGTRRVLIYNFVLKRDDDWVTMRVLGNPMVDRVLKLLNLRVIPTMTIRAGVRQPQKSGHPLH